MKLVDDLLDRQVVDRNGQKMGRADSIVLDVHAGRPPRIVAIEIGPSALGDRLHPRAGRWVRACERALGIADRRPVRIAIDDIQRKDGKLMANVASGETGAVNLEQRLRALMRTLKWS